MRTLKEPEERRNEILDVAYELFSSKGYDSTSVLDILEKTGIAKGTLYYYFKGKEDIMNAVIVRILAGMMEKAGAVAIDSSLSVHDKLLQVISSLHLDESQGKEILEHIHNPQNALMHQKQLEALVQGVTPILSTIVEEGVLQGLFTTPFPYESAEMLIIYSQIAFDHPSFNSEEEAVRKVSAFICNMERILGAETGSFDYMRQLFN
ncbi:transcriptional regulator [Sphaerochaeta pleomorpha str. Grapes]|uniref:Transcriptional regulator n=1 Tax=Sphaerochaeta pleomorpha (strain ATCC BAA-1885 / DSM 22778 / Grapes) TaxID=158190 RepID=G8QQR3_SPHPG|nr:TetR/AcrR family transcriptional regulator [Sphaerochaeta pleomorpha]AEV28694.1 transcriptional regulator [Sphaerochaeta pleomorpha str. Grapes]